MAIQQKIFLGFFLVFTLFLAGLYGYALQLPSTWQVERAIVIDADPEAIWAKVGDLNAWDAWHPWTTERDESLKFEITGEPGVGQQRVFFGNMAGRGRMLVTEFEPNAKLAYDLEFVGTKPSKRIIAISPAADGGTRVAWIDTGEMDGVLDRFAIKHIEAGMDYDFKLGLEKLKEVVEAK